MKEEKSAQSPPSYIGESDDWKQTNSLLPAYQKPDMAYMQVKQHFLFNDLGTILARIGPPISALER